MARLGALFDENEPLVTAAVIAAEATGGHEVFRQRDVRFFIELFSNWLEPTTGEHALALHNTQVLASPGRLDPGEVGAARRPLTAAVASDA